jgi:hypothetical protein
LGTAHHYAQQTKCKENCARKTANAKIYKSGNADQKTGKDGHRKKLFHPEFQLFT